MQQWGTQDVNNDLFLHKQWAASRAVWWWFLAQTYPRKWQVERDSADRIIFADVEVDCTRQLEP